MTQEEKELLLKDLCARLPYDVLMNGKLTNSIGRDNINFVLEPTLLAAAIACGCKPYLRSMSSMTEEEREELSDYLCEKVMSNKIDITIPPNPIQGKGIPFIWMGDCLDWLNKHHFDYRGLIEKGLAIEAPEDMYKNQKV